MKRPHVDSPTELLSRRFGFSRFRPHQQEIIEAITAGRDVFAALPTGGGKSLCYQLPSLVLPGVVVVVSPLIALMHDQVQGALQNGLDAAYINSTMDQSGIEAVWHAASRGEVSLLYVSPERVAAQTFRRRLAGLEVSLFAVDEAHCISEWGHEFRPDYRVLSVLKGEFPQTPVAAFTATATRQVQEDVVTQLGLDRPLCIRGDFDRPEIFYRVERKDNLNRQITRFVRNHGAEPGIIYRATRKSVEQTAAALAKTGISARPYHAGLPDEQRSLHQDLFVKDGIQVIVATIAFGMGIDKSNVRWIIHADMPRSIEGYYQETGRAGRDGEPAEAVLFFGPQDLAKIRYHIDQISDPDETERAEWALQKMLRYANASVCRRVPLLAHFDQPHGGNCGGCDICTGTGRMLDRSTDAQKVMSAMVRTGERFGAHHIADIVHGTRTQKVSQFGHDQLPTFAVGNDKPRDYWLAMVGDMEAAGYIMRRDGRVSGLVLADSGRKILAGSAKFMVAERNAPAGSGGRSTGLSPVGTLRVAASPAGPGASNPPDRGDAGSLEEGGEELFQQLRALRLRLAREQSVPPYVVFSDRSLRDMARLAPTTAEEFLAVHGVGARKAQKYTQPFTGVIREYLGDS